MKSAAMVAAALLACAAQSVRADAGWFESGDYALRTDLALLNDAGVIRVPMNTWPIPRAAVSYALASAKEHFAVNAAVAAALERTRARVAQRATGVAVDARASLGEASLTRDFDALAREDAELSAGLAWGGERVAVSLRVAGAADAADDRQMRVDGSHATVALGNWLVSAHTLDRWWGPAHESSLILSNNARPMPTLMVERAEARPFESRWLSWLGPWRFSFAISQMERDRADIDEPLFMAWRVVVMPLKDIELGFSRTAQFCGEQLVCDVDSFVDMLIGNDNIGFDATPESEPGNQMAGFDIRINSPIGDGPYAIYGQYIGEDESGYLPAKYLGQLGFEVWKSFGDGGILQGFAEYANTTCSALSSRGPYYNCSYNQGRFDVEGYRYRGRVIGHTTDSDAESYALGAVYETAAADTWTATLRAARLNHDGTDPRNTVSASPADYGALELGWRSELWGGSISVDVGVEALRPEGGDHEVEPFGFLSWRHSLR
jgi:hypothetical protein